MSLRMILLILSQPVQRDVGFSSHVSLPLLARLDLDSNCVNSHWVLVNKAKNQTYGTRSFFITKTCFSVALPNPTAQQVYKNNLNLKHLSFFNLCLCPLVVSTSTCNRMLLTLYRSRVCIPSQSRMALSAYGPTSGVFDFGPFSLFDLVHNPLGQFVSVLLLACKHVC